MNKLETPCIQCGADRVYTHHNDKTDKWTVYCDTCCGGYTGEEEAVAAYMRVVGMRDVIEWLYGCPYIFDEATIPRAGIAAAPEQVVVNMSVAWPTIQRIAEIHAALEEVNDE